LANFVHGLRHFAHGSSASPEAGFFGFVRLGAGLVPEVGCCGGSAVPVLVAAGPGFSGGFGGSGVDAGSAGASGLTGSLAIG
jgi:hypothetical protein